MPALPTREEPNYFGAGPALLPIDVLQQAACDLINYKDLGLGIGEISHRSKEATDVINKTKANLRKLMNIPDTHEVFFMQGGGTTGFSSVASNMFAASHGKGKGAYLVTGSWSLKSVQEAQRLNVPCEIIYNAKDHNHGKFGVVPSNNDFKITAEDNFSYCYICENETVHGVEYQELPVLPAGVELCADLSSDILSRKIDVSKYGVILAGAQKNIGLAGLTLYIVKKSILEKIESCPKGVTPITPIAFDWPTVVKNNSAYNTIPIFTLHIMDLVFEHLLAKGGVSEQQKENEEKSKILYTVLDSHPDFYALPVDKSCRSKMNVVFTLKKEGLDEKFLKESTADKLTGLKGHRSVGGFRASLYNAVTIESASKLAKFCDEFAKQNK